MAMMMAMPSVCALNTCSKQHRSTAAPTFKPRLVRGFFSQFFYVENDAMRVCAVLLLMAGLSTAAVAEDYRAAKPGEWLQVRL